VIRRLDFGLAGRRRDTKSCVVIGHLRLGVTR
jgi:hypothetical protein